jgi:Spy/CpxP family protein refolding chaperone
MKSKTSAALLLVAIFVLGGVAGGVSHYLYENHFVSNPPPRPRVPNSHDIVEEMAQHLKLDAQQKEQLKAIVQQSRDHYRVLSRQFQPQYEKIRGETNEAIREILRPDQRKQYEATLEKMDARHRDRTHDAPPDQPGISK